MITKETIEEIKRELFRNDSLPPWPFLVPPGWFAYADRFLESAEWLEVQDEYVEQGLEAGGD